MIEEGRGKLEWERKIPDEKLSELKDLLSAAEFKANMPKVSLFDIVLFPHLSNDCLDHQAHL